MTTEPRLAVHLPAYAATDPGNWNHLFDRARAADAAGIDRLVISDHVVFGENLEAYSHAELGGKDGGRQPTGPDGHWLEPMTVLSVVCGMTSRVRLTTSILLAALRRPVVLAKAATTLDILSGGRFDMGVGVGWQREEYEAAGLDFDSRGKLLDQSLAAMQTLWRDNPASFHSDGLNFESIHFMPKPLRPGGVPIWVSGTMNAAALRRIVGFGSGWIPWGPFMLDPGPGVERVRQALVEAGRDPSGFCVLATLEPVYDSDGRADLAATFASVGKFCEAGVTDFRVNLPVPHGLAEGTEYLSSVVERFDQITGRAPTTAAPRGGPS
jgi:probable F420-dependent oxidoreductase